MATEAEGVGVQALAEKINQLIREGNVRRIVVRNDQGRTVLDIPVTVGVAAALMMPMLTAAGSVVALIGGWTIEVEHPDPDVVDQPDDGDNDSDGEAG